jgi:hypothetical protein
MDCVDNNSYVITLAIQTHGKVIDLNLSPEISHIFNNVRLFSKSGDFVDAFSSRFQDQNILLKVNKLFQQDLDAPTLGLMNEYVEYSHPIYKRFLEKASTDTNNDNVCRLFDNVTFDKSFSTSTASDGSRFMCLVDRLLNTISPEFNGVFVVSVHQKLAENDFKLIYPSPEHMGTNLNLLKVNDFNTFARMFNNDQVVGRLIESSYELPISQYKQQYYTVMKNYSLTYQEKLQLLEPIHAAFYEQLKRWAITMKRPDEIESIRMSTLVEAVKQIMNGKCNINLLDYSCNSPSLSLPERDKANIKYLVTPDIEVGTTRSWGGKSNNRNKRVKSRKTRKTKGGRRISRSKNKSGKK